MNLGFSISFNKQEKKKDPQKAKYLQEKKKYYSYKKPATLLLVHSYTKLKADVTVSGDCLFLLPHMTYLCPLFPRQSLDTAPT